MPSQASTSFRISSRRVILATSVAAACLAGLQARVLSFVSLTCPARSCLRQFKGDSSAQCQDGCQLSRRTVLAGLLPLFGSEEAQAGVTVAEFSGDASNRTRQMKLLGAIDFQDTRLQKAVAQTRKEFGGSSKQMLVALDRYGTFLLALEKDAEAQGVFQDELELCKKLLGSNHPDCLWVANNEAVILKRLGDFDGARRLFEGTYNTRKSTLGALHPDTLASKNNYAVLVKAQGRLDEAERLYREILGERRQVLGANHVDTLTTANNLAVLLTGTGKNVEAEQLYKQVVDGSRATLGEDNLDTMLSLDNYAVFLLGRGRLREAEPLFETTILGFNALLGPLHPDTLRSMDNLAVLLQSRGRLKEALPLLRAAADGLRFALGETHPDSIASERNLEELFNDIEQEEKMMARAVSMPDADVLSTAPLQV